MKKKLLLRCLILSLPLSGCWDNKNLQQIDPSTRTSQNWLSVEQELADQLWKSNYLSDINDFFTLDKLNKSQKSDFSSDENINIVFDKDSSIEWWVVLSVEKSTQWEDSISDIAFSINADDTKTEPFLASWNISLLHFSWNFYMQIHNFGLFNGEGNMQTKFFSLLANELKNKWIDLEMTWWKIETMDIWIDLFNISLFSDKISDSSQSVKWLQNILSFTDQYAKRWIDIHNLSLSSIKRISYTVDKKWIIWKGFEWSFNSEWNKFDALINTSQKWFRIYIYNVAEFDEDTEQFRQRDIEIDVSLEENKKSDYSLAISSSKNKQKTLNLSWKLIFDNWVKINANFVLEPLEIIAGQKFSWKIEWTIQKKSSLNREIPQLSWETLYISKISSTLF